MTQRHRKKSNFFLFGTPYGVNRRHIQSDFSVNFNKVFESWTKLRDSLTPASNVEAERLRHILPCLFQANQNGSVGPKNVQRKSRQNPKDLNVCYQLKCSDMEKNNVNKTRKNTKTTVKKIHKTQSKEKPSRPTINTSTKLKKVNSKTKNKDSRKKINPTRKINSFECPECKRCSEMLLEKSLPKKRKRNKTNTLTLSQERLLQALIELDPRAYGDSVSLGLQGSSKTVQLKENSNINIKNLELKYLNPTYVIQMTTEATPPPRKYERAFSFAALDAHLGQTPCPNVVRTKRASERTSMHYDDSEPHIVGVGQGTEQMWRERQNSTGYERAASHRSNRSNSKDERTVTFTEDPPPLFLLTAQEPLEVKRVDTSTPKKTESKRNSFVEFIKRCFCLSGGKESDSNFVKLEIPSRKLEKNDLERLKKCAKVNKKTNANATITRTTRDEFIKTNKTTTQG